MQSIKFKENIIYIILWALVLIGYMLHFYEDHAERMGALVWGAAIVRAIDVIFPLLALFLVNNFLLIPRMIQSHRLWIYALSVGLVLIIYGLWEYGDVVGDLQHHGMMPPHSEQFRTMDYPYASGRPPRHQSLIPMPFIHTMFYAVLVIGVNLAISILVRYIKLNIEKEKLEAANVRGQLDHLKAQINPHFYMNMLNSIHGLVDIDPSKAKELVMEMSRLMRYMLYDSSRDYISLRRELDFLKEYIRIIHSRYPDGKVAISTSFPDNKKIENIEIPPLLFIVFIENAFKYGVDYRYESSLAIDMEIVGNQLHFSCMNFIHPRSDNDRIRHGGIGLSNIRKRLELLYAGNAILDISETDKLYIVNLVIPVNETKDPDNR